MFWIALVPMALVFLVISFRLEKMTNQLEGRQEALRHIRESSAEQKRQLLLVLRNATGPAEIELWRQYHQVDFEQAKAEVEYVLTYGEKEDSWNYEANKQAAFKHEYEASQWIERASQRDNSPREGMI